jgi:hypothetical protein
VRNPFISDRHIISVAKINLANRRVPVRRGGGSNEVVGERRCREDLGGLGEIPHLILLSMGEVGRVGLESHGTVVGRVLVFDIFVQSHQMGEGFQYLWESRRQDEDVVGDQVGFRIWVTVLAKSLLPLNHLGLDGPLELFSESESRPSGPLCRVDDDIGCCGIDGNLDTKVSETNSIWYTWSDKFRAVLRVD